MLTEACLLAKATLAGADAFVVELQPPTLKVTANWVAVGSKAIILCSGVGDFFEVAVIPEIRPCMRLCTSLCVPAQACAHSRACDVPQIRSSRTAVGQVGDWNKSWDCIPIPTLFFDLVGVSGCTLASNQFVCMCWYGR